jgi:hypothetical protein
MLNKLPDIILYRHAGHIKEGTRYALVLLFTHSGLGLGNAMPADAIEAPSTDETTDWGFCCLDVG